MNGGFCMIKNLQSFCLSLGNYGCYALCIIDVAEEYLKRKFSYNEIFEYIEKAIDKDFIEFHKDDHNNKDNFYVSHPDAFLEMMTNRKCRVRKDAAKYKAKNNEYVVERWTNGSYAHFARVNNNFNSLQTSACVNKGKIESTRVFTIV